MADQPRQSQPTIENADDVFLDAKSKFDQWMQEFEANWYKPQVQTAAKVLWSKQPDQVKNYIRQSKPKAAKQMDDLITGREG